jgi:hypothetical protein
VNEPIDTSRYVEVRCEEGIDYEELSQRLRSHGLSFSDAICTDAIEVTAVVPPWNSLDELYSLLRAEVALKVRLAWRHQSSSFVDERNIGLMALYPSSEVRSVGVTRSSSPDGASIEVTDVLDLLDPNADSPLEETGRGLSLSAIIFAVHYPA